MDYHGYELIWYLTLCLFPYFVFKYVVYISLSLGSLYLIWYLKRRLEADVDFKGTAVLITGCDSGKFSLVNSSSVFIPITLGTTEKIATIPFYCVLFSAALVELIKFIPIPPLLFSTSSFFFFHCVLFSKPVDLDKLASPRDMLLSLQMGFSFVRATVACAILERISGFEPSSETS